MMRKFGADKVITEHISEANLSTYFVGFDLNDNNEKCYRINTLVDLLLEVIPEFAFGYHDGITTDNTQIISKIREAARAIYKIDSFCDIRDKCSNGEILTDDITDKYLRKGEFGELILHLLLRDYKETIPLLSKIYFKDSTGVTVHGFDAVHIQEDSKTLWLGESKLYFDGKRGISALVQDIKEHFVSDYLNDEFAIISRKLNMASNVPNKDYWLNLISRSTKLSEKLNNINIPLLCTYESNLFSEYDDEALPEFITEYEREMQNLKLYFESKRNAHPLSTNLNIILLLFPIRSKLELLSKLHNNLDVMQNIGGY